MVMKRLPVAVPDVVMQIKAADDFPTGAVAAPKIDRVSVAVQLFKDVVNMWAQFHVPGDQGVVDVEKDIHGRTLAVMSVARKFLSATRLKSERGRLLVLSERWGIRIPG